MKTIWRIVSRLRDHTRTRHHGIHGIVHHGIHVPITVTMHSTKNTCKGIIWCSALNNVSRTEILSEMADYKVIDVYRYTKLEEGRQTPLHKYVLTFDCTTRPERVFFGRLLVKVAVYIPNPRLCKKCQRYGHGQNTCRNKAICAKCGEEGHEYRICKADKPHCFHCSGEHPSSSRSCPMFELEKRVLTLQAEDKLTIGDARKRVYSHCQDYVAQVPSLSKHLRNTWSQVAARPPTPHRGESHTLLNSKNQAQTQASAQTTNDSTSFFDHPAFKVFTDQQRQTQAMLAQMQQQQQQNHEMFQMMQQNMQQQTSYVCIY